MALEMKNAIADPNHAWLAKGIRQVSKCAWASTGFSTVGNFGDERMDYTIIGKQANLANRLQAAAQPGVLIGQDCVGRMRSRVLPRNPSRPKARSTDPDLCGDWYRAPCRPRAH
jgi:hypothetical protein